jgi:hypothetical protein
VKLAASVRQRRLDMLAADQPAAWRRIEAMIDTKKPGEYDLAVRLLVDLRDLNDRDGHELQFTQQLADIRARHAKKPSLLTRLRAAGLGN